MMFFLKKTPRMKEYFIEQNNKNNNHFAKRLDIDIFFKGQGSKVTF